MRSSFQFCWISVFPWIKPPEILALGKTSLNDSTESGDSSVRGHLPLIRKDSSYMHGLAACVNKELLLHGIISWKPCGFLLMFFVSFTSLSVFLLFSLSVAVFNSNSSNTDEVFSINPSANVFVFGNFGSHHKDWLTFLMELIDLVNPVIIFLSQMTLVRWLTFLLESLTVTLIIVLLFCIYLFHMMLVFVLQRFSLHWEILIMFLSQFPLIFQWTENRMPFFNA